ncbi:MAG: DUF4157 domain-containing protein [Terracidiphilus sp.]|jgi:hypothetical protein
MAANATAAPKHAPAAPRSATVGRAPVKAAAPATKHDAAPTPSRTPSPAPALPAFAKPAVATLHPAASAAAAPKLIPMPAHPQMHEAAHGSASPIAPVAAKPPVLLNATLKPAEHPHEAHLHASHKPAVPIPITHKAAAPAPVAPKPAAPKPAAPTHKESHTAVKPKLAPLGPPKTPSTGAGQPLAPHIKEAIQNSLMVDLSSVRLHASTAAERKAQSLTARAFTFGNDIFLGHGEHPTDLTLISHEAAHVIQQQHAAPVVQAWSSDRSDRYEREADQAAAAVASGRSFAVRERVDSPRVQRFGISDALDWLADKAYIIPGFRMFTIVLGVNPVNMQHVERSAANVLRAIVEFLPGGTLITDALDKYGVFDKVGNWISGKIDELGMVGSSIKNALMDFLDSLSWRDIFHLGDVWDRAKHIFTDPIDKIINFVKGTIEDIWKFVRDAVLKPISKLAEGTSGWPLLIAVMGKNPITGEAVPRTPDTLIGGFMHLIHEDEIWENIKKANAVARAFAWFQSVLSGLLGFVSQIPDLFIKALKSLTWSDILDLPGGFMKIVGVFGKFLVNFISWAGGKVWDLLQLIFEVVAPAVMPYLKKVGAAFKNILKHPLDFVRHLIAAAKLGLENFVKKFPEHLKKALIDWLVGALPGVYIPKALSLTEFGMFALSVLGVTWAQIRAKIVKALGPNGETIMKGLETALDIVVALIKGGPAAAWDLIKEKLTNLKDMLVDGIVGFVTDTIIKKAIPKLISLFIPGAGFISAIISIYDSIMVFVQKLAKIAAAVKAFVDSIVAIAADQIDGAAQKVEDGLEGMLSIAISFLAGFLGLGNIASKILEVIKKVQALVDKGLDAAINWVITKAKALFAKLFGKKEDKKDERTEEEKTKAKLAAISDAEALVPEEGFDEQITRGKLAPIKSKYKLLTLDLVVESKDDKIETLHFEASASDKVSGKQKKTKVAVALSLVVLSKPFEAREKPASGPKLAMTRAEFHRQVGIQQAALNKLSVTTWRANWKTFYGTEGKEDDAEGRTEEAQASRDRAAAVEVERIKVAGIWLKNNPKKAADDADAFTTKLFAPNPGPKPSPKAYPFLNKSLVSNGVEYVNEAYGKSILHAADQAAGGGSETAGLGGSRENFSIGAQWDRGGRAETLKGQLDTEIASASKTSAPSIVNASKLNVELPVKDV